jgi:hypothetical protein
VRNKLRWNLAVGLNTEELRRGSPLATRSRARRCGGAEHNIRLQGKSTRIGTYKLQGLPQPFTVKIACATALDTVFHDCI